MNGPIFTTGERLYVEPRLWTAQLRGPASWVGTGSAVVRRDVADPRMLTADYSRVHDGRAYNVTDETLTTMVNSVCGSAVEFVKRGSVKTKHLETSLPLEIAFYERPDASQDGRVFFLDTLLGGAPDTVYGASEGEVRHVVNNARPAQVTLLVACYDAVASGSPIYRRVLRKLGREV